MNHNCLNIEYNLLDGLLIKSVAAGMIGSPEGRHRLGRFLIRGVCQMYEGRYNPHNITGLGSALWVVQNWWEQPVVAISALFQYLDYFFQEIGPES